MTDNSKGERQPIPFDEVVKVLVNTPPAHKKKSTEQVGEQDDKRPAPPSPAG